jgi:hypothetical protein
LAALVRWRGKSFFICQPHLPEHYVDSLERTIQPGSTSQFFQRQIVLFLEQGPELLAMKWKNSGFATCQVMLRGDVPGSPPLL